MLVITLGGKVVKTDTGGAMLSDLHSADRKPLYYEAIGIWD
jgi:hypothetical protein